ncbi:MAG: anti-sigma factor [Acidimicrobiales bacterium]|nr:anti-sigma factor [Acidimicrobiales bacterium]
MNASIPEPSHDEIRDLLGAYALDAVDPETAAMVEHHLEGCLRCSTEVAQHHEVAGLLANSGGASPATLWDGIASQLDGSTPPSWGRLSARLETGADRTDDLTGGREYAAAGAGAADGAPDGAANVIPITKDRRRGRWVAWTASAVAGAAAVVAVLLGAQVHHLDRQVAALQAPLSGAEQNALKAPSTKRVQLTAHPSTGTPVDVMVVLTKSGAGFVQAGQLSRLPTDQTYQLWGVVGQKTISLGLLGARPTVVAFSVAGSAAVSAFAITAEHAGGVVQSSNQPVVAGQVSA